MSPRLLLLLALAGAAPAAALAAPAAPASAPAGMLTVTIDQAKVAQLPAGTRTLVVGNPAIADVTMIDARHAFVQGKGFGRTNIVALNSDNVQVFNTHVTVTGGEGSGTVTLNRGAQRITLNCAGGRCEPTPTLGDDQKVYDAESQQTSAHQTAARGMATAEASK